jgi:hypothetical protein
LWYDSDSFERSKKLSAGNKEFQLLAGALHASSARLVAGSLFTEGTGIFFDGQRLGERYQMKRLGPTSGSVWLSDQPEDRRAALLILFELIASILLPSCRWSVTVGNV